MPVLQSCTTRLKVPGVLQLRLRHCSLASLLVQPPSTVTDTTAPKTLRGRLLACCSSLCLLPFCSSLSQCASFPSLPCFSCPFQVHSLVYQTRLVSSVLRHPGSAQLLARGPETRLVRLGTENRLACEREPHRVCAQAIRAKSTVSYGVLVEVAGACLLVEVAGA